MGKVFCGCVIILCITLIVEFVAFILKTKFSHYKIKDTDYDYRLVNDSKLFAYKDDVVTFKIEAENGFRFYRKDLRNKMYIIEYIKDNNEMPHIVRYHPVFKSRLKKKYCFKPDLYVIYIPEGTAIKGFELAK